MVDEIRIFVPVAIKSLIDTLAPRLERLGAVKLIREFDLNPTIPKRISAGEAYDIGLTNPHYVVPLIAEGRVLSESHQAFGRVPLAVGSSAGLGPPTIDDRRGIKELFEAASSIAYTETGTSGQTYLRAIEDLGLASSIRDKSREMGAGQPVAAVAAGEVQLAVAPLTTILSTAGVELAAIFPSSLGANIDISIFLNLTASEKAARIHAFLVSPELDKDLAAAGIARFNLDKEEKPN